MKVQDKRSLRKHLFVDPKVQGALVARVILYWLVCLITIALMLLCWRIMVSGPARLPHTHLDEMWFYYGPAVIASFLLLPLVIVDIVRLSNRFAGPMLRLRRSIRELARGEHVEPIGFRDNDFWQDFAEEFNALLARVQRETPSAEAKRDEHEEPVGAGVE
ncbi:MAG: hypothetical protein JXB62_09730 [Pirellulales bacterium]|nr:hypothetical protein [Pirellulales bacterium]